MRPDLEAPLVDPSDGLRRISDRFISELFLALERHEISPVQLLGDLPIPVDENGLVTSPVQWDHLCTFLRRLEHHVGGPDGLERCGEWICAARNKRAIRRILAFSTSPTSLYRAATAWAAPRVMPGIAVTFVAAGANRLSIEMRLPGVLRPCPQLLHIAAGAFRALPRVLQMPDSVVFAKVEERGAHYDITIPSSRTGLARLRRLVRSILAPGAVMRHLEDRQLELHARHASLSRALEELIASERQLRALSDTVVDMLCEIDASGRILFVSASVRDLMGYSSEQVAGSHYRLWVPNEVRDHVTAGFERLRSAPVGTAVVKQRIVLHAAHGRRVVAQVSTRSHRTSEGAWRAVAILRDVTQDDASRDLRAAAPRGSAATRDEDRGATAPSALDRLRAGRFAVQSRHAGHPLERSLGQLVSALEALEQGAAPAIADRFHEATRRMTRIVEHALAREEEGASDAQWIETRKLVDRARDTHASRSESNELALRIDVARGPAEIWGAEALLDACIAGLIDWAGERARAGIGSPTAGSIALSIETAPVAEDHEPELSITVEYETRSARVGGVEAGAATDRATSPVRSSDAELALAIVRDAARALGGDLVETPLARAECARTVRLPQPVGPAQSESRSMSAPMARSFSSIRS